MIELTKKEILLYNRQIKVKEIGLLGQQQIANSKVLVVGAGGLGCPTLLYLTTAGVGTIGIIDFDKIEDHNLPRQILFTPSDLGKKKAIVAEKKLKEINPSTHFLVFDERLNKSNILEILSQFDIIVDGSDNFSTRYLINDNCVLSGKPLVYGSILGFEGQLAVFNFNGSKNLRDLFPEPPHPKDIPNCDENGVLATLPGIIGTLMAQETLKLIIGQSISANQLVMIQTLDLSITKIEF
jgi:molybdopterin-synthase adenylyltransferase